MPDAEYGHGFAVVFFVFGGRAFGHVFVQNEGVDGLRAEYGADEAVVVFVLRVGEHGFSLFCGVLQAV